MSKKTVIFCYGTLKKSHRNNSILQRGGAKFLGEAVTKPKYALYNVGWFPGLVEDENGRAIKGEIYEIDEDLRKRCDAYEGVPNLYKPKQIELDSNDYPQVSAYIYQGSTKELVNVGDSWDD